METQDKLIKPDRRAVRSKRLIIGALRELILEKDYNKISVSDIVERADIGRATFYAHFEDKDHLGRFLFGQLLAQIEQEIEFSLAENTTKDNDNQQLVPSLALFRIAQEKHRWFRSNAKTPEIGLGMLIQPLIERLKNRLDELGLSESEDEIPRQFVATYLASALIALLTDWVISDMPETPEVMDERYQTLAAPTFSRLLKLSVQPRTKSL